MGVGLALSKLIVEAMGGKIWFDSDLGKGSKFMFTCKLKKQSE
jgi:signal transduction histidine kinase